jgi:hypothetical protein
MRADLDTKVPGNVLGVAPQPFPHQPGAIYPLETLVFVRILPISNHDVGSAYK